MLTIKNTLNKLIGSILKLFSPRVCLSVFFLFVLAAKGQGVKIAPLQQAFRNPTQLQQNLHLAVITDTLNLPFFDNFTAEEGYPSLKRWTDNQAWINNNFPIGQPDFNVATLDHLDFKGIPYDNNLNKNLFVYADSLTSQPINLQFYKTGPVSTKNYSVADSLYLSFFYETKGLGDIPEAEDSLILFFKNNAGQWKRVWWQTGIGMSKFKQAMVPVLSTEFLHPVFQFRWVNYTKSTGNLNHWHIDYVRFDKNRSAKDTGIRDVAIRLSSEGLLKNFRTMPYAHFLNDPIGQAWGSHSVTVRNLNSTATVQTRFQLEVKNRYNNLVLLRPFAQSSRNILPGDSSETFGPLVMDTLSGKQPELRLTYKIAPQSDDITPDNYNAEGNNNEYSYTQHFTPWYAWDDGSAEGGFGLNYEFLPDIKGQFAMKMNLVKADSLRGLAIYFNRSLADVSFRKFNIRIWKEISPIGATDNKDKLIYEFPVGTPRYTDSINHFSYIYFDSVLFLPQGTYYIGWVQYQNFVLNVGYDNNYRHQRQEVRNPNLYFNLLGQWENSDASVMGTPMIRPMFGDAAQYSFGLKRQASPALSVYPNPTAEKLFWKESINLQSLGIYNQLGKLVIYCPEPENGLDVSGLAPGVYQLKFRLWDGSLGFSKFIKK